MKVGVAGLGRMGSAIAKRLIEVGHEVVVWNRNQDKTKALAAAGAAVAATPSELAGRVETIITILTDAGAIAGVYEGKSGLLEGNVSGKLFIEMSTVQPETEIALAKKVGAKGATLVECPVGGTVGPALSGKLLGLAGGTQEDFARAKPLLEQMCRRVDLVGPVGAGASMKLAINLPLATFWQSFGEAFALCRHLNLDPAWVVELVRRYVRRPQRASRPRRRGCAGVAGQGFGLGDLRLRFDPQGFAHHGRGSKVARLRAAAG